MGEILLSLKRLVEISNFYGKNPELVLAGGGNTSYKDENHLYIKGSGTSLETISEQGFVKMSRKKLSDMWVAEYPANTAEREHMVLELLSDAKEKGEESKRPSVETSLHDLLPQKYVVHLHPAIVNGMGCSINGEKIAKELFGDEMLWIPPVEPGWVLATTIKKYLDEYTKKHGVCSIIMLENHGIFVADDDPEVIKHKYDKILSKLKSMVREPDFSEVEFDKERAALTAPVIRTLLGSFSEEENDLKSIVVFKTNKQIMGFVKDEESFKPLSKSYTPDHIVYCRAIPLFVKNNEDIEILYENIEKGINEYKAKYGFNPKIIAIEKLGIFAHGASKKNADITALLFFDSIKVSVYSESFGGHKFLSDYLTDFIVNWEVENYRSNVSLKSDKNRLSEKVVVITGAAQGFGQGIAESLLQQGINVVIADLNGELAEKNAIDICERYGSGRAYAVKTDVSDENSVKNMIYETVLEYGGIDCMVSNAGIARSGNIEEMSKDFFELSMKINYTGYFMCAKYSSRIMKLQYRYNKNYFMDIIQVNSKSGLVGSNKNFAYAGSKFGGIGLTQSFALELVEFNIKVNSVCPGNFFDGPLWSDPEKGLFKLYLESGKAPGAKTVDDVKRFYESKIPMKKGCLPVDVSRAIAYCIEQRYETGQAIPVTGGQTMLK